MKKFFSVFLSIFLLITTLFYGCNSNRVLTFTAFSTPVIIQSNDKPIKDSVKEQITQLFAHLENEFSTSKQNSTTSAFNNLNTNQTLNVSSRFAFVLEQCTSLYQFTNGAFNPCILPLLEVWKFTDYKVLNFTPPTTEQVSSALAICDFNAVKLNENTISKTQQGVKLDFGGILKGYALDLALEILKENGYQTGYISVGGSSLALLSVNSLSVKHPRATQNKPTILSINCENKNYLTLSTSGDYERYYDYNGTRYSHIIDAKTGLPTQTGVASATLLGVSGVESDALTTAICTMHHSPTDLIQSALVSMLNKISSTYSNAEFYIVYDKDGVKQILTNKKQGEDFTLLDTEYTVVNI